MYVLNLSQKQFEKISGLIYQKAGIKLLTGKEEFIKSRLSKRLRALELTDFDQYLKLLERDLTGAEMKAMVECLTTHKTFFYRESEHFEYLRRNIIPEFNKSRRIRIWSAACSSGEEPYTIAMILKEYWTQIEQFDVRILGTDISTQILSKAKNGIYEEAQVQELPNKLRSKYLTKIQSDPNSLYRVNDEIKRKVQFAKLNLIEDWPMQGAFDVIFCRNVMIYFDKHTQLSLAARFRDVLRDGGYLFVGHSENLSSAVPGLQSVSPAVYIRKS